MSDKKLEKNSKVKEYIIEKKISEGGYGRTYLANKDGKKYIIKQRCLNSIGNGRDKMISEFIKDKNNNLFHYIEYIDEDGYTYFVSEYIGKSLRDALDKYYYKYDKYYECWEIEEIKEFVNQILCILAFFHYNKIYHRDIKPENICIKQNKENEQKNIYVIIDYSSGIKLVKDQEITLTKKEYYRHKFGTYKYLHPKINELIYCDGKEKKLYYENIDIWSLGLICLELFTGKSLYYLFDCEEKEFYKTFDKIEHYLIPYNEDRTTVELVQFIDCMLQYDSNNQFGVSELSKLDFINKNPKDFKKLPKEEAEKKIVEKDNEKYLKLNFRNGLNIDYTKLLNKDKGIKNTSFY